MIQQTTFSLRARSRGFHLVTEEVLRQLPALPQTGLLNLFIQHTSAALSINENADPDVRTDMESIFNHLVKEREPYYEHTFEGADDMPAHAKVKKAAMLYKRKMYGSAYDMFSDVKDAADNIVYEALSDGFECEFF